MAEHEPDDALFGALARLRRHDLAPAQAERVRARAHVALALSTKRASSTARARLARTYTRLIEPVLLASYGAYVVSKVYSVLTLP